VSPCPDSEVLERVIAGTLTPAESFSLRSHLVACNRCQGALDRMSDDPVLRGWKAGKAEPPEAEEAHWVKHIVATFRTRQSHQAHLLASFLEPPRREGDWGALGPYRVLAEVGQGGMGIVLRAYDDSLARTVAIKVLRPELATEATRGRLLHEAQAAARFTHDHAVRIYAVALTGQGLPYIVMEYLDGPTLAEPIATAPPLGPRQAAELVAQVADALAAAHAAGLIHRDVKPANIILDPVSGRAKLLDFGLARAAERPSGMTQDGVVAGTPVYMSPEQAQGTPVLDGRTDVYSLGVTLYEALTGEVPFHGKPHLVLQQIALEEPRPPRWLNDAIPRDLETICLKAMAKEPARRYTSAAEFAADLRRFPRGEPVRARPVGAPERFGRWCRRNPKVAGLAAALVLVLSTGFAAVAWQWRRAEAQAAAARRSFLDAQDTVDNYLTAVSEDPELKAQNFEPLRRKLLGMARDHYEAFVRSHPDDPSLQAELGMAHGRLGIITAVLDSPPDSLDQFERKRTIFERLCQQQPGDAAYRKELAETYWRIGYGRHYAGRLEPAWDAFIRARQLWEELAAAYPDELEYPARWIRPLNSLGRSYTIHRNRAEAEQTFLEGRSVYARWSAQHAVEARHQESIAWVLANLGSLYRTTRRPEAAREPLQEAVTLGEALVASQPRELGPQEMLRHALVELGWVHYDLGQAVPSEKAWQRARTVSEQMTRAHPGNGEYQSGLAEAWECLGRLNRELLARPAEAQQAFQNAQTIQEKLMADFPTCWPYVQSVQETAVQHSRLFADIGQPEAGLECLDHVSRLLDAFDSHRDQMGRWTLLLSDRALTLARLGRFAEGRADLERARVLSKAHLEHREFQHLRELIAAWESLATGRHADAAAQARAIANDPQAPTSLQGSVTLGIPYDWPCVAAELLCRCAAAARQDEGLPSTERRRLAEQYAAQAVALLRDALAAGRVGRSRVRSLASLNREVQPLRSRVDFQQLLAASEAPVPATLQSSTSPVSR
jgi:tRNA A-37 threonylcarbamoyl transferase component Bud32/tetratricopeptide (TPR) repeat protein